MADGRAAELIAYAIRSVGIESLTGNEIAALLGDGDLADEAARRVLVALRNAGLDIRTTRNVMLLRINERALEIANARGDQYSPHCDCESCKAALADAVLELGMSDA